MTKPIRLAQSNPAPCAYLTDRSERLHLVMGSIVPTQYQSLLASGYRRSGNQVYKPHCLSCRACVPIRLPVQHFALSLSQKRIINNNRDLQWQIRFDTCSTDYQLYCDYISKRHADGSMYPPSKIQFDQFIPCQWLETIYLEARLNQKLVLVAVTDLLPDALSATYTYFDPSLNKRSLGKRAILAQIALAQYLNKKHLYLGYQIEGCQKMAYKNSYHPYEQFTSQGWKQEA